MMTSLAVLGLSLTGARVEADFAYPDFSSTSGLKLNGEAAPVGSVLRLSKASDWNSGSAFTKAAIPLGTGNSFSTYFQFRISNPGGIGDGDGIGADGLVFVVQPNSNSIGGSGGGMGYAGIGHSLGVEFDTYDNGKGAGDPDGNHVGINLNGNLNSVATASERVRFNDGQTWNAWVDYNGTKNQLDVRWSLTDLRPLASQLSRTVDLASIVGQNSAYIGFTSATGGAYGDHDILNWQFRSTYDPFSTVPEPASLVSCGIAAVAGLAFARRRMTGR